MTRPTRGFFGRRQDRDPRLPPGQYDVGSDWPVLTAEHARHVLEVTLAAYASIADGRTHTVETTF